MTQKVRSWAHPSLAAACLVWAGMVLGISFLEAWVKFTAPSLTLPVGLDVGRHVFGVLNLVELGGTVLTLVLVLLAGLCLRSGALAMLAGVWAIVAAQSLWLLPALDARAARIIAGEAVPGSAPHVFFVALEAAKVLLLFGVAALLLRERPTATPTPTAALMQNGTDTDEISRSAMR